MHNKRFYKVAFERFGVSAQGVNWISQETQYKRFEIINSQIDNISSSSIIDAGCGFGEFYNFLEKNKILPKQYIGLDCEEHMIKEAQNRFEDVEFQKSNILYDGLNEADYYICSGAMNIMTYTQVEIFIQRCYEYSLRSFIFNYLKYLTFTDVSQDDILDICNRICPNVKVIEGYLENDFTVVMVKSQK